MQTTSRSLNDGWRFQEIPPSYATPSAVLPWLPATVPGHVHADLAKAGVIGEPYERMNERGAAWIDELDWVYETTFHLDQPTAPQTQLVFDGIDTIAEIELNGEELGRTANMFIPHEFSVGGRLRWGDGEAGDNLLRVTFRSAQRVGRERLAAWIDSGQPHPEPHWNNFGPRAFVRKSQYMFGWDWGPELASYGLWRSVRLVEIPTARLLDWSYETAFQEDGSAEVTITAYTERAPNALDTALTFTTYITRVGNETDTFDDPLPIPITASVPAEAGRVCTSLTLKIDTPRLWWPNRHNPTGEGIHPPLYTLQMTLDGPEGQADTRRAKIGLRTIELIREADPDGKGEGFKFRVNGEDMYAKGANWIPSDSFPSRPENEADRVESTDGDSRVYNLIWDACDLGFNMLRVWGGGLYESEHFYELCDEHGILVWQDFAYACAQYPDTGEYAEAARAEAVAAVRRLRVHPSLALWCGNNENNWFYEHGEPYLGTHLYHEILPAVVQEEDPGTVYWPGSPFGGEDANSADYGDKHNWDVWHGIGDWTNFTSDNARFVSEFGFAASCGLPAWHSCLAPEDWDPNSPVVRWHDKTRKGYETYLNYITLHYPASVTLEDLVYHSQINQADALKYGIEHYRRLKGRCWGTLFWQINDCWPVQSWAIIDSELEPKAAFFAAMKFYAPVLLSLVRADTQVQVHLTSDLLAPTSGELSLALMTFDGETLAEQTYPVTVAANATAKIATFDLTVGQGREREVYVYAMFTPSDGSNVCDNFLMLAEPKDLALADPGLSLDVQEYDVETLVVTVAAERFAYAVWLHTGEVHAELSDNFFHLQSGETREILLTKTDLFFTPEEALDILHVRSLVPEVSTISEK